MSKPIKILYIDPEYQITFFNNHSKPLGHYAVSIGEAVDLLKTEEFDLILSEAHNRAYLNPQRPGSGEKQGRIAI